MLWLMYMEKKKAEIVDIIPLVRMPLMRNQSFSYLSAEKVAAGDLVKIPLFKRQVEGVVLGQRPDFPRLGNIELKKVISILEPGLLDTKQIALAQFIAQHYFAPLGLVLKSFVPKRVKSRSANRVAQNRVAQIGKSIGKKIILTNEQRIAVDEISKRHAKYQIQNTRYYLYGPAGSGKTEIYAHAMRELSQKDPEAQFLVLVPELTLTPQAIERYGNYFAAEEIVSIQSGLPKGTFYTNWKKIKSGEAKIIIGSRMAVFAPFKKLRLIAIDEEQDMSFKQWDMTPRYDARRVAEKLAELHSARIIFGSATPSLENYYRAANGQLQLLQLPALKLPGKREGGLPETLLVDMRKERWKNNQSGPANLSPLSRKLQSEISYALNNGLQIVLFINRQGMSSFSVCAACKTVLKCPDCDRALVYEQRGFYKCLHCAYQTSIMPSCAKCKGLIFTNIGLGTQKVEREILDRFPTAQVARADNQTMQLPGAQEKIYREFSDGQFDILIGTQMISKGWDLPNVALIGIIDADNLLSVADFSASIRTYQNIVQVSGRTGRPNSKRRGVVLIQTFNPDNFVFKAAAERDFPKLYAKEITEREGLFYPPFGQLIKLIFQGLDNQKVKAETERVYELFEQAAIPKVSVAEPQEPLIGKVRGNFRRQIIIKIKSAENSDFSSELRSIINSLPAGWLIDVDPISIA